MNDMEAAETDQQYKNRLVREISAMSLRQMIFMLMRMAFYNPLAYQEALEFIDKKGIE
jgi:hypothetical protein